MSNDEKVKIVHEMIHDFWEYNSEENMKAGAIAFISVIHTIIDLEGRNDGN